MQACAAPTHTYMSLLPLPLLYFMSLQSNGGVLLSLRAFWVMTCVLTGYRQFGEVAAQRVIFTRSLATQREHVPCTMIRKMHTTASSSSSTAIKLLLLHAAAHCANTALLYYTTTEVMDRLLLSPYDEVQWRVTAARHSAAHISTCVFSVRYVFIARQTASLFVKETSSGALLLLLLPTTATAAASSCTAVAAASYLLNGATARVLGFVMYASAGCNVMMVYYTVLWDTCSYKRLQHSRVLADCQSSSTVLSAVADAALILHICCTAVAQQRLHCASVP
eukprot:17347-Heterococcus_DN1.PRE.10